MNTDFPEYLFPAVNNYYVYNNNIEFGKKIAKDKTIIFCGIVRNADQYIERNILRILRTAKEFKDFAVFIYENDSTDNTKTILLKYHRDPFIIVCEDGIKNDYLEAFKAGKDTTSELRCNILSQCRNKYLEYINNTNYDYTCIVDLDLKGGWSYDGFFDSIAIINQKQDVACVSAYGILSEYNNMAPLEQKIPSEYMMYDSLAFRPFNYDKQLSYMIQSQFNFFKTHRGDEPLLVYSNFNGLAIYKTSYLKNKKYSIRINPNNPVDCDHVIMHEQIRKSGGKILLNPNLIVSYSHHRFSQL
jgi:hypothetical protein